MIKVTVLYPNLPGKKFDMAYNTDKHLPMVQQRLKAFGLVGSEVEQGISAADPKAPAPFVAVTNLYFRTVEQLHEGFKTHGREIMGDIKNYTDIQPQFQISEIVG